MKFVATAIDGAFLVEPEAHADARGSFARLWCSEEFSAHGIDIGIAQASRSWNPRAGTLRGMHFQRLPSREAKLVRCERGRIFDAIIDLRPHSPTFMAHLALELDAITGAAIYVPAGCAHGFLTLEDDCAVHYMMSEGQQAQLASGVRYDDPAFGITWPRPVACIHERDRSYPDFDPQACRDSWRRTEEPNP
ncbi:MAG: dTDP-4-dehydrorhamnose 3,5-epimerase family protein [Burkholderiales bacterium]|nr:dTDP-4-dehydrorhamnose 3,5-epimerase family protein [Burkholderiales bacterium]